MLVLGAVLAVCLPGAPVNWVALSGAQRTQTLLKAGNLASRYLELDAARVHFIESGPRTDGDVPWVFVHGLGGEMGDFGPVLLALDGRARVFALDLPGFGKSIAHARDYTVEAYGHLLKSFLHAIEAPAVRLVCHSLGGQVCLGFALDHPQRVVSLVLIASAGAYERGEYLQEVSGKFNLGHLAGDKLPGAAMVDGGGEVLARFVVHPAMLAALSSFHTSYRARVRDLEPPLMIVWGAADRVFSVDDAFFLLQNVAGARLHVVEDAGHLPQLSHPTLVTSWLLDFHRGTPPATLRCR